MTLGRALCALVAVTLVVAAILLRRADPAAAPLPNVEWRGWWDDNADTRAWFESVPSVWN